MFGQPLFRAKDTVSDSVGSMNFAGSAPRIAVIGAGPMGLAVAHALRKNGASVEVFDAWNVGPRQTR
ncbi:MAG TPA: NAD(P)-binding protein [Burkholderiaceae bacterium]|nr:NAD(P)-binding protein [Burkholderiaceae bacterium]